MRKPEEIATAFAPRDSLEGKASFFLVGIGGAGMSALARMLKHRGYTVRGTDSTQSPETDRLNSEGIAVHIGHSGEGIGAEDAVVLSDAIDLNTSPEVARARELDLPLFRRSQVLGWLLKPYKVIAVTGTHGKTTTTGMTGAGLIEAGLDPLVVAGANIPEWGGPVREGKGEWAVVEACEAYDAFHDLDPWYVILTNLELDHVDYHGSWENLRNSVLRFVDRVPQEGALVYCGEDAGAKEVVGLAKARGEAYAGTLPELANGVMGLPGEHNRLNAAGALTAAKLAGAEPDRAISGIRSFRGAERRLQVLRDAEITVLDDYAHHPTEIAASLGAIRERYVRGGGRLIVIYQPHLYSRTADLIPEFAEALSEADLVVLTDIYPAREAPIPGVSSARIAELVKKPVMYIPSRHLLPRKVAAIAREGDVVVGMGAGNISEFAPEFIREWERLEGARGQGPGARDGVTRGENEEPSALRPQPSALTHLPSALRIAVLYGGDSAEREVSILSGRAIHESLKRQGYQSSFVDVSELLLKTGDLSRFIGPKRPHLCFLAVHGTHAEDGAIQGLLELLHIPYTGSDIQASAIAMDKELTKAVLQRHGIRVPQGQLLTSPEDLDKLELQGDSFVVKPNAQGSTVGLSFVSNRSELAEAVRRAFEYDSAVLVEEWIKGMEISVPVLGDRALQPVEIAPASGVYDFASKYTPGATEEIVPARLAPEVLERAMSTALQAHNALKCEGATRTDIMVRDPQGAAQLFVLEVNTLPGMTGTSLLPNSAQAAGISFDDLTRWLVEDALKRHVTQA